MNAPPAKPVDHRKLPGRGRGQSRWLLKRAVELRMRGLSYEDIAEKIGVPRSTIHEQLHGVFALLDPERIRAFEEHRVPIMTALEMKMLGALADDGRIAKASLNNAAYAFTQVHQARRLEQGQSTANLALHELVERVERDGRRMRATTGSVTPAATEIPASQVLATTGERV